jgi:hypothetical protein
MEVQALKRQLYIAMKRHEASREASWRFIAASTAEASTGGPFLRNEADTNLNKSAL